MYVLCTPNLWENVLYSRFNSGMALFTDNLLFQRVTVNLITPIMKYGLLPRLRGWNEVSRCFRWSSSHRPKYLANLVIFGLALI